MYKTCLVLSSYTVSFESDPVVTNLSPEELYAHAKICLIGSANVPIQELVETCHIFVLPSASAKDNKNSKMDMKQPLYPVPYSQIKRCIGVC